MIPPLKNCFNELMETFVGLSRIKEQEDIKDFFHGCNGVQRRFFFPAVSQRIPSLWRQYNLTVPSSCSLFLDSQFLLLRLTQYCKQR